MKILDLKQGAQEWKEARRNSVTASDFAVIAANNGLCNNLFHKSIKRLIRDKKSGLEQKDNFYFKTGRDLEPLILDQSGLISLIRGEVIAYEENNNIIASLDARDDILGCIVEVKTTTKPYEKKEELIDYYSYQVIHQIFTAGYTFGYLIIAYLTKQFEHITTETYKINKNDFILTEYEWLVMCNKFLGDLK